MTALYQPFDDAIIAIADYLMPQGFDVSYDGAPETLADITDYFETYGRVCVDGRNSEATIYGAPRVNHAFRAWHDLTHIKRQFAFTFEGEIETCQAQQSTLTRHIGRAVSRDTLATLHALLWAEIVEQAEAYRDTGEFIADQRAFVRERVAARGFVL